MSSQGIKPDTKFICAMIADYTKHQDIISADDWFAKLAVWELKPNQWCSNTMLNARAKMGDIPGAILWLFRMGAADMQANAISFSCLMDACAKAGDVEQDQQMF